MNLLRGFKMRLNKTRHSPALPELAELSFSGTDFSGEPALEEMLSDPVIKSLMKRDNVSSGDIVCLIARTERAAA